MVEKARKEDEEEVQTGDSYETVVANMNDEKWCIEHWMELGESGQQWALSIHGMQLWQKVLDS